MVNTFGLARLDVAQHIPEVVDYHVNALACFFGLKLKQEQLIGLHLFSHMVTGVMRRIGKEKKTYYILYKFRTR